MLEAARSPEVGLRPTPTRGVADAALASARWLGLGDVLLPILGRKPRRVGAMSGSGSGPADEEVKGGSGSVKGQSKHSDKSTPASCTGNFFSQILNTLTFNLCRSTNAVRTFGWRGTGDSQTLSTCRIAAATIEIK